MAKVIIFILFLIPFCSRAQNDVLILQRRGMHVKAYTVGDQLTFKTVYGQWFDGIIGDLYHDTVYIVGQAFNYKEIAAIRRTKSNIDYSAIGKFMMVAGGGFMAIGAVNGLLRHDPANQWYTTSGYIIGGTLVGVGLILSQAGGKNYNLGGRFKLTYLQLTKDGPRHPH
jgi:hypothetical protein